MTDDEKAEQQFRAIAMWNRLSVAKIKLKRADKLSDGFGARIKEIDQNIGLLTDDLLVGDDVRSSLDRIEKQVHALEAGI